MTRPTRYKPKSKRRKMMSFKLEEISVVDKPAQAGAVMTIMKAAGNTIMSAKGESTVFDDIRKDWRAIGAKLEKLEKAGRNPPRDLRNRERAAPYLPDEDEGEEFGEEFEKEPEEEEYEVEDEVEDEDDLEKERINTTRGDSKRTAADHEGDWPGAGTEGGAQRRRAKTRVDGHVSGDEGDSMGEMTPQRASDVLQPYAREDEEDEDRLTEDEVDEAADEVTAKAHDFMKRDRRMSPQRAHDMALQRVGDRLDVDYLAKRGYRPVFGREREIARRQLATQPVTKTYSDAELADRLEKRFGKPLSIVLARCTHVGKRPCP